MEQPNAFTSSKGPEMPTDQVLENQINDLQKIERDLLPILDELGQKIPELYGAYASATRECVSCIVNVLQESGRDAAKIAIIGEIAARGVAAFGEIKAVREHNKMLKKFLEAKMQIANAGVAKVKKLIPLTKKSVDTTGRLLNINFERTLSFDKLSEYGFLKATNMGIRMLTMYRTALFFNELANYLDKEYTAWLGGNQTSGAPRPDYYTANSKICSSIYPKDLCGHLEATADECSSLKLKDAVLIADPQLTAYAFGDEVCELKLSEAHPYVGMLLENNEGLKKYAETVAPVKKHIEEMSSLVVGIICLIAITAIICLAIFAMPGTAMLRLVLASAGCAAVIKVWVAGSRKANLLQVERDVTLGVNFYNEMQSFCGKIEGPDTDLEERSIIKAAFNGFMNG